MSLESILGEAAQRQGGTRGRQGQAPPYAVARNLTADDVLAIALGNEGAEDVPLLKKVRARHHSLAKLIAQGVPNVEIGAILGMQPAWISTCKRDPAMAELIGYYEGLEKEHWDRARADMASRLAELGFSAIEELHDKLEREPEKFTAKELLAIVEATADRTGHGKTSTLNSNLNLGMSDDVLAAIRNNASAGQANRLSPENSEALLRVAYRQTGLRGSPQESGAVSEAGAPLREEGDASAAETLAGTLLPPLD